MAIEDLMDKIKGESKKETDRIIREAEKKIKEIEEEIDEQARIESEKILADAKKKAVLIQKQEASRADLESRRLISGEKNRLVEELFKNMCGIILAVPETEKKKIMARLVKDAKAIGNDCVIKVDKNYSNLIQTDLKLIESNIGDFGIIIESHDGSAVIDNRLDNYINQLKIEIKPKVSKILFD